MPKQSLTSINLNKVSSGSPLHDYLSANDCRIGRPVTGPARDHCTTVEELESFMQQVTDRSFISGVRGFKNDKLDNNADVPTARREDENT